MTNALFYKNGTATAIRGGHAQEPTCLSRFLFLLPPCTQSETILCIVSNKYANYLDLEHAENDVKEMGELFKSRGHEVTVLTGKEVATRTPEAALDDNPAFVYFQVMAGKTGLSSRMEFSHWRIYAVPEQCFIGLLLYRERSKAQRC